MHGSRSCKRGGRMKSTLWHTESVDFEPFLGIFLVMSHLVVCLSQNGSEKMQRKQARSICKSLRSKTRGAGRAREASSTCGTVTDNKQIVQMIAPRTSPETGSVRDPRREIIPPMGACFALRPKCRKDGREKTRVFLSARGRSIALFLFCFSLEVLEFRKIC